MNVRVRYAPSPTGLQHIGGVRTALFNYFFARSQGGRFVLRIEDTDRERFHPDALKDVYDTFSWLGIHWDEGPDVGGPFGPYVQSERFEMYREAAEELVKNGHAYRCYCTPERLDELKRYQEEHKLAPGYDRHCRNLAPAQEEEYRAQGIRPVVRLKVPLEGSTVMDDLILGKIERKNEDVSVDPVLLKSDGFPTYHLANVVDDHYMEITHILRAQEWVPSGPLHILLYRAFGWEPPQYCHLPFVTGSDGRKLSKRHGATSIIEFRNAGYLPEALINYISLLGWSFDDSREFFTVSDLEKLFSLDKLNKSPGVFDYKKLEWFNGTYIREKPEDELVEAIIPFLQTAGVLSSTVSPDQRALLHRAMPIARERLHLLSDAPAVLGFLFQEIREYRIEDAIPKKMDLADTIGALDLALGLLDGFESRLDEELEQSFRNLADEKGMKLGGLLMPVRVAVTGSRVSPPLFPSMRLLGAGKSLERINQLKQFLIEQQGREHGR